MTQKTAHLAPGMLAAILLVAAGLPAAEIDPDVFGGLEARSIGPAVMSGRIAALDAVPGERLTLWVGAASGGVWKSVDGGLQFTPVFDEHAQSIGAITVDPSNPDVVWVGTGESWVRNSVSRGDGVYRSEDGGETWQKLGLEGTERIARIVVHPDDGKTAWVCATGAAFADHEERGVFRTKDGGKSWDKVLFVGFGAGLTWGAAVTGWSVTSDLHGIPVNFMDRVRQSVLNISVPLTKE